MDTDSPPKIPTPTETANATVVPVTENATDKRTGSRYTKPLDFADADTAKKNPNRLSNVRFKLGEEPWHDVDGTHEDDPYVNVKLEVVENPDPDPDQKALLNMNGPLLRMKCALCGKPLRIGASKKNKEVLEEGGFVFKPYQIVAHLNDELAACVCPEGHVTQLRMDMAMRLRQHV